MECADTAKVARSRKKCGGFDTVHQKLQHKPDFVAQPIDFTFGLPLQKLYLSELCDEARYVSYISATSFPSPAQLTIDIHSRSRLWPANRRRTHSLLAHFMC